MKKLIPILKLASKGIKLYDPRDSKIDLLKETADQVDKNMADVKPSEPEQSSTETVIPDTTSSPLSSPSHNKTREYTRKQAIKHLIAVEDHLKSDDKDVCESCLGEKHLPALEQYAEEGKDYCDNECGTYSQLKSVVSETEDAMKGDFDEEIRNKLADEFRNIRKGISPGKEVADELAKKLS